MEERTACLIEALLGDVANKAAVGPSFTRLKDETVLDDGPFVGGRSWVYCSGADDGDVDFRILEVPDMFLGGRIWPVSVFLSDYIAQRLQKSSAFPSALTVLELGAGCGLVGILLAKLGHKVVLTDTPAMLPLLHENVAAAAKSTGAIAAVLAWGDEADARRIAANGPFDVIVGSDVTYLRHVRKSVLQTLTWLCSPSTLVLLSHASREEELLSTRNKQYKAGRRVGYRCGEVDLCGAQVQETPEAVAEAFADVLEQVGLLAQADLVDPPELNSKSRQTSIMLFRPRADAAARIGLRLERDGYALDDSGEAEVEGVVDRDEACTCCGAPVSLALHTRRGICDSCLREF